MSLAYILGGGSASRRRLHRGRRVRPLLVTGWWLLLPQIGIGWV